MTIDVNARNGRHIPRALLALACVALAAPASALASSGGGTGGGGLGGTGTTGGAGTTSPSAPTAPAPAPVSVSGDGVTLQTVGSAMVRRQLAFAGTASASAGAGIEIEREGKATHGRWVPTIAATVAAGGAFTADWVAAQPGRFSMRAIIEPGPGSHPAARTAAVTPSLVVTVYRGSRATIYGPGFYGRRTACGQRLTRTTVGVANRTLPCGSSVSILYDGRTLTVPVIDRGPYANGADWDLTFATASALGIEGTVQIGTVRRSRGTGATTTATPSGATAPVLGAQYLPGR